MTYMKDMTLSFPCAAHAKGSQSVTKQEALSHIQSSPENEHFAVVRLSQRHKRVNGEPKRYLRLEASPGQIEAFYEAFEGMVARWGRERAMDRVIAALADANAADGAE
jgi:hypothetical protein